MAGVRRSRMESCRLHGGFKWGVQCLDMRMLKGAFKRFCRLWSLYCGRRTFFPFWFVDRKLFFVFTVRVPFSGLFDIVWTGLWLKKELHYTWKNCSKQAHNLQSLHILIFVYLVRFASFGRVTATARGANYRGPITVPPIMRETTTPETVSRTLYERSLGSF